MKSTTPASNGNQGVKLNMLLVMEDPSLSESVKNSAITNDWNIFLADPKEDILSRIQEHEIQTIISDIGSKRKKALSFLKRLKEFDSLLDVIFIGESLSTDAVVEMINQGVMDFLPKPLRVDLLERSLKKISTKRSLRRETFRLEKELEKKYFFQGMIGKSPYMLEVFSLIDNISKHFTSVLVTGETGSGKELVARAVSRLSGIEDDKFIICDCVAIPENLFESELFGYVRGAFTGADRDKKGLFEEANGGIIFLDEIGEVPLFVQAKLLRALEQHQFRPLGSNRNTRVDVKVIAATSRDLREGTKTGSFREDLFHRLNKVEIHLPPLRERSEDISLLVRHFLERYSQKFKKKLKGISRPVQKLFLYYHWPGNVRELENVLERAAMLCTKDFIDTGDLPDYLQKFSSKKQAIPVLDRENLSTLDEIEKEYISFLLKKTNNNLKNTAKILNISRTTLYNKIKKYDIPH